MKFNWKKELKDRLWMYDNRIDFDDDAWDIYWKQEWEEFIEKILLYESGLKIKINTNAKNSGTVIFN